MKSIEDLLSELAHRQHSSSAAFTSNQYNRHSLLPEALRQSANRGWQVFPFSPLAKLTGNPDLLINEATSDISRLEELAAEYPICDWRVAVGPSSLCILHLSGQQGRDSFAVLAQEQGESLTLQVLRENTACAFFRWPEGLVLRDSAKNLAAGVRILRRSESCVIPPSGGSFFMNPWADIETVPFWLRELAFENPDSPHGNAVHVPASSRPTPCRSRAPLVKPCPGKRKGHPICNHTGWRGGFRISSRR